MNATDDSQLVRTRVHRFEAEQRVARQLPEVFEFFSLVENLERITPPWLCFSLTGQSPGALGAGATISYRLRLHSVPFTWVSRIEAFERDRRFIDRQLTGPYKLWIHQHTFERDGDHHTIIRDLVRYQLPFGVVGALVLPFVRRDVARIFEYRRMAIGELL